MAGQIEQVRTDPWSPDDNLPDTQPLGQGAGADPGRRPGAVRFSGHRGVSRRATQRHQAVPAERRGALAGPAPAGPWPTASSGSRDPAPGRVSAASAPNLRWQGLDRPPERQDRPGARRPGTGDSAATGWADHDRHDLGRGSRSSISISASGRVNWRNERDRLSRLARRPMPMRPSMTATRPKVSPPDGKPPMEAARDHPAARPRAPSRRAATTWRSFRHQAPDGGRGAITAIYYPAGSRRDRPLAPGRRDRDLALARRRAPAASSSGSDGRPA